MNRTRTRRLAQACAFALALTAAGAQAAGKHEHGAVALDVTLDGTRLLLRMSSPLDNLLGFEHAPRNAAERQRVEALATRLKAAEALFRVDPAAGCVRGAVRLDAPVVGLRYDAGAAPPDDAKAGHDHDHADIDAEFEFDCPRAPLARHIDVALWDAFPGVQRLDVQLATARGQAKRTLRRPTARLPLNP